MQAAVVSRPITSLPALSRALSCFLIAMTLPIMLFPFIACIRLVDGDEGFYLYAARLVGEGQIPYVDFFFPQMPLTAYLFGFFGWLVGFSWHSSRLFAAVFPILTAALIYVWILKNTEEPKLAILGVWLFSFSSLSASWLVVIKTYGVSTFLLFLAFTLCTTQILKCAAWRLFTTGCLLGLVVDTRLYLSACLPLFLLVIPFLGFRLSAPKAMATFGAGVALTISPLYFFLAADFEQFMFNNLGFHLTRTRLDPTYLLYNKFELILRFFGGSLALGEFEGLQTQLLAIPTVATLFRRQFTPIGVRFSAALAILLVVVAIVPSPTYFQYLVLAIPFLIVNAVYLLGTMDFSSKKAIIFGGLIGILFFCSGPITLLQQPGYGFALPPTESQEQWQIQTITRASLELDAAAKNSKNAMSWWPGYFVESKTKVYPGFENHFGRIAARGLSPADRTRFHLPAAQSVYYSSSSTPVVVIGNWLTETESANMIRSLESIGCKSSSPQSSAIVFVCPGPSQQT